MPENTRTRLRLAVKQTNTRVSDRKSRDRYDWRVESGLSEALVRQLDAEYREHDLGVEDVAAYRRDEAWRFIAVWSTHLDALKESRMSLAKPRAQWQAGFDKNTPDGFYPRTLQYGIDGGHATMLSQLWRKQSGRWAFEQLERRDLLAADPFYSAEFSPAGLDLELRIDTQSRDDVLTLVEIENEAYIGGPGLNVTISAPEVNVLTRTDGDPHQTSTTARSGADVDVVQGGDFESVANAAAGADNPSSFPGAVAMLMTDSAKPDVLATHSMSTFLGALPDVRQAFDSKEVIDGDANADGRVDFDDFRKLRANFGASDASMHWVMFKGAVGTIHSSISTLTVWSMWRIAVCGLKTGWEQRSGMRI